VLGEIEIVLQVKTESWIGLGWRPLGKSLYTDIVVRKAFTWCMSFAGFFYTTLSFTLPSSKMRYIVLQHDDGRSVPQTSYIFDLGQ